MEAGGNATYKKKEGFVAIHKGKPHVSWTPSDTKSTESVQLPIEDITNLMQTPESSPKVMLKVFISTKGQDEAVAHVFTFTSATAREDANSVKKFLTIAIQYHKLKREAETVVGSGPGASMAVEKAITGGSAGSAVYDDEKLLADLSLHESLRREHPTLQKTFEESRKLKPDSLSNTQFTSQFWRSRIHLLRAHSIVQNQTRGSYNVLSSLKPTSDGGDKKLSLSKEHVHLIFTQYPLVLRVYDAVVPKRYDETTFWSRFFQSKLYKKLRGLKIDQNDSTDVVLDQYLDAEEFSGGRPRDTGFQVAKIIDMEGNEENHSQRKGNAPHLELRPQSLDKVPIIRTLNNLSEKLMAPVAPSDVDPSQPIGVDETTYENLRLRDLSGDPEQNRIILNVRDQSRFFTDSQDSKDRSKTSPKGAFDPSKALDSVRNDLAAAFPSPGTDHIKVDGYSEAADIDPDDEDDASTSSSAKATSHIMGLIQQQSLQSQPIPLQSGLSTIVYSRTSLTHDTTAEFLKQFWSAFLSGSPSRVSEITALIESLDRSIERMNAVANDAEGERRAKIKALEDEARMIRERTGIVRRVDRNAVGGGKAVVEALLGPMRRAVGIAKEKYQRALEEQTQP